MSNLQSLANTFISPLISKTSASLGAVFFLMFVSWSVSAAPAIIPRAPDIAASSYILIDATTGHVIVEKNSQEALPPASLTKIMTAYIAAEEIISGNLLLAD